MIKRTYEELYLAFETYADGFSMPLHLCGISLGAILALHYTLNHPDNVSSLVLIAPQYKMPKFLLSIQSMVFHRMPERSFSKVGITKQDFISLTNSMRNLDFTWNLKTILCPTLIICGQTDTANIRAAKKTAARISNATLHIIEKAGHEVNIEAPQKLANLLNLFYGATIF